MNLSDMLAHLRKELRQINKSIKALERIEEEERQEDTNLVFGGVRHLPGQSERENIPWAN
jgi:hypothetical protein